MMEAVKKKTRKEIIDETAAAYTLANRSVSTTSGNCLYVGEDGCRCAFARCMVDPHQAEEGKAAHEVLDEFGSACLKPEYRGHSPEFWMAIQGLHDCESNWSDTGLSPHGVVVVNMLHAKWDEVSA